MHFGNYQYSAMLIYQYPQVSKYIQISYVHTWISIDIPVRTNQYIQISYVHTWISTVQYRYTSTHKSVHPNLLCSHMVCHKVDVNRNNFSLNIFIEVHTSLCIYNIAGAKPEVPRDMQEKLIYQHRDTHTHTYVTQQSLISSWTV